MQVVRKRTRSHTFSIRRDFSLFKVKLRQLIICFSVTDGLTQDSVCVPAGRMG